MNTRNFSHIEKQNLITPSAIALVAANLVPLVGVVFWNWKVFPVFVLFWSENVIIGLFNAVKILLAQGGGDADRKEKLSALPFFLVHYGFFCTIHFLAIVAIFAETGEGESLRQRNDFLRLLSDYHVGYAVVGMVSSHAVSFWNNYLGKQEYLHATVKKLFFQPYVRVFSLHLVIIACGLLLVVLGQPVLGLSLLILIKMILDLNAHMKERVKFSSLGNSVSSKESRLPG